MSEASLRRGLERQLETRADLLARGAKPLGWKAGFGAPEWLSRFGTEGPLVGFLTDASIVPDGGTVDISGWARAVAEPEIAVTPAIGPAIELADIQPPPEAAEEILTGNIFHRGVVLGGSDPARAGADLTGLEARIRQVGHEEVRTDQLETLAGNVIDVVTHLASLLTGVGETMKAGEVVICGSVIPPLKLTPGSPVEFGLHPMPPISVRTAPANTPDSEE
jgi:2-keto-4-pentenoate hydratase